jgi:hypothetical protein
LGKTKVGQWGGEALEALGKTDIGKWGGDALGWAGKQGGKAVDWLGQQGGKALDWAGKQREKAINWGSDALNWAGRQGDNLLKPLDDLLTGRNLEMAGVPRGAIPNIDAPTPTPRPKSPTSSPHSKAPDVDPANPARVEPEVPAPRNADGTANIKQEVGEAGLRGADNAVGAGRVVDDTAKGAAGEVVEEGAERGTREAAETGIERGTREATEEGGKRGAGEIAEKHGEQGVEFVAKHGDEGAEFLAHYGDDALNLPANQIDDFLSWKKKLTPETQQFFKDNPELWRVYANMDPDVRKVLTLCNSPCIPSGATAEQANRIKAFLSKSSLSGDNPGLKKYFHDAADLDAAIDKIDDLAGKLNTGVLDTLLKKADALNIVLNYGDDAVELVARYGDDAINALPNLAKEFPPDQLKILVENIKSGRLAGDVSDALHRVAVGGTNATGAIGELNGFNRAIERGYERVEVIKPPSGKGAPQGVKSPEAKTFKGVEEFRLEQKTATEPPQYSHWKKQFDHANKQIKGSGLQGDIQFDFRNVDITTGELNNQAQIEWFIADRMREDRARSINYFEILWRQPDGTVMKTYRSRNVDGKVTEIITEAL